MVDLLSIFLSLLGGASSAAQQDAMNSFNASEAEKNRDFQSGEASVSRDWQSLEAALNRDFQSDEAKAQRDWSSAESEASRLFSHNEAALQRTWSSQEAERARDWQEEMYQKYNSLSGKIAQAEQAGVNPLFAVTGSAVSPMSAVSSVPSGASASGSALGGSSASGSSVGGSGVPGGSSATAAFVDLVGSMLGFSKLKSEIDLNEARAKREISESNKTDIEASWVDKLSEAQLDNLVASKDELESRLGVNAETANKLKAEFSKLVHETSRIAQITDVEKRKLEAEAELSRWTADNREWLLAIDAGSAVLGSVTQIATQYMQDKTKLILGGKK